MNGHGRVPVKPFTKTDSGADWPTGYNLAASDLEPSIWRNKTQF